MGMARARAGSQAVPTIPAIKNARPIFKSI